MCVCVSACTRVCVYVSSTHYYINAYCILLISMVRNVP